MVETTQQSELAMIANALRTLLERHWPADKAARSGEDGAALADLWARLSAEGFATVGTGGDSGGLKAGVTLARELGRANCPAPCISRMVAAFIGDAAGGTGIESEQPCAIAFAGRDGAAGAGEARLVNGRLHGRVRFVEDYRIARTLLVMVEGGVAVVAGDAAGLSETPMPGLAVPALSDLRFDDVPADFIAVPEDRLDDAAMFCRLLLAARAEGAARRSFELVTAYVQERVQFNQPLARFQSMQHKLADGVIALDAAWLAIAAAAAAFDAGDAWRFPANMAIAFASGQLRKVSLETHHAFGAIGYAEDHEAPRHFRRVHADLTRMGGMARARAMLADHLLAAGQPQLPLGGLGPEVEAFRTRIRAWLEANWTADDCRAARARPFHARGFDTAFARKLGAGGWLDAGWPKDDVGGYGGQGLSPLCQLVLVEELTRAGAPVVGICVSAFLIAPAIIRHGTPWLQEALLPGIRRGDHVFALGYSEPQAGSDLASLQTRAVRDGDHYVINGQKMWGTGSELASHIALAVRTDPDARPKSAGISVILVPTDLPGITIRPGMALYGQSFCTQFFDDVRVPAGYMLGPENGGWAVLAGALAAERIVMGGQVVEIETLFEDVCRYVARSPAMREDARARDMLGQYAAEIGVARQLSVHSARVLEQGRVPLVEGAMAKLFSGDLAERFAEAAIDLLGTVAILGEDSADAAMDGRIEQALRKSIMQVIGGGAAEIQKTLIAQRGLGLPR